MEINDVWFIELFIDLISKLEKFGVFANPYKVELHWN